MKKVLSLILCTLISAGLLAICFLTQCFSQKWEIIFSVVVGLTLISNFLGALVWPRIFKTTVVCLVLEVAIIGIYLILYYTGLLVHFESKETLQAWIVSFGAWAPIMFFVIELAQVILIPVPAQITTLAGVFAFGPWKAFVISSLAIISGSFIAFAIGRSLGVKVLYKIAKKETVDKYRKLLSKKGRLLLPIMFLFPVFPDDLLCFIVGTTTMSWLYFIVVTLTTRLVGIACICAFLGGEIIPFSGWGIPVWIVIGIVMIVVVAWLFKNQDRFEQFIIDKFTKHKKPSKTKIAQKVEMESSDDYVIFSESDQNQKDSVQFSENKANDGNKIDNEKKA